MYEFRLPDLGEGIHEGEVLRWHVEAGASIGEDEPLVDVETDKAAVTIPSPRAGRITALGAEVGDTVTVGEIITVIDDGNGAGAAPSPTIVSEPAPPAQTPVGAPTPAAGKPARTAAGKAIATPATRRMARELKIDISQVVPTGPGGRVTSADVRRFAESGVAASAPTTALATKRGTAPVADVESRHRSWMTGGHPPGIPFLDVEPLPEFEQWGPVEREPLRSIRRRVAHKMTTSMILVPHVAHMDDADVTELEEFRRAERERRIGQPGGKLTLLAFVVKAVTAGLRAAPAFNASLDPFNEELVYKKYYNIGIAVDTGRGLIVPVIRDTDRKSIIQISADIESAARKARDGELEVTDLRGGTFTITNVGPLGGTALIPTINYPEVAILGMGKAQQKPVVRDGEITIRTILPLTLAFDHRVADGADAARFVTEMVRQLSDPRRLLLET